GYDVGLDRKVALKLVRRQLLNRPAVRDRMVREAKAMARLSSAHVVQVYQVGPHRDGIYVAMEYVEGEALGAWLEARPRSWQAVLRTLGGAGRGLAAAHAAGLVHRDFKPENVLVDADGHARVLDFGLVHSEHGTGSMGDTDELSQSAAGVEDTVHSTGAGDVVERSALHWSVRLTRFGRTVGTPAYMSPEQHFGEPVGPYSDQYSFAVTLYEALYGARPFNGDSWDSLKAQVRRGEVPPPPPDSRVPGWVHKILVRGLAVAPAQRWPNMQAMVDALERDPRRTRMRVVGLVGLVGLVVAASAASYALATARTAAVDRCGGGAQELAGVWDEARRHDLRRAFAATRASFAEDVLRRTSTRLDAYADAWAAAHRAACEANVAGNQTDNLLDLRMACLGRQRTRVSALVDVLATADRSVVENAVQAVAALPSAQACADAEALLAAPPPSDPQTTLRVDQMRRQLAQAGALEDTGRYEQGLVLAEKVRGEAALLGYAPLDAEAALAVGSLLMAVGRSAEADKALVRALQLGIVHDLHAEAAEAAAKRIFVLSQGLQQPAAALVTEPTAEALVQRARDDGRLTAL
ncbi:MAG: serine/threonine protein kinase, partial [Myxococcales bacterium]|nr:serine/threonine protein kinase [Myxococcales bacterium]